ncbi:hypothetical protein [Oenococcus sicerae]|uniref:hypothetical protein n=1 Tax=Oenococcus sicerae TaxID=2203724 RepID=UPI0039E8F98A
MTEDIGVEITKTANNLVKVYPVTFPEALYYAKKCYVMFHDFDQSHLQVALSDLNERMAGMK